VELEAFVDEFGDCLVQESRHVGRDFTLVRVRDFWDEACTVPPVWAVDAPPARYVFHDNLSRVREPGSVERLRHFFAHHPASLEIIARSKRCPCVAQELTFGGPNSGTPVPHTHGTTELQLIAGTKEWWLWPIEAAPLVELVMRGAQARNRLEYWLEHFDPLFQHSCGDVTELVLESIHKLVRRGLLVPSPPRATGDTAAYIAACAAMRRWQSEQRGIIAEQHRASMLIQCAGEAIVVPEGQPHAVRNLDWHLAVIHELLHSTIAQPLRRTA
jgi:hypothetical protein